MLSIPPEVLSVLRRFSQRIAERDVVDVTAHAGFSGASVWRVATSQTAWALRQWPRAALPARRIRGLHRLLKHIEQNGLNCIAVPVADDGGATLISDGAHDWQLEPWLPGTADFGRDPNPARLTAAMKALAAWHRAAAAFVPSEDCRRWFGLHPAAPSPAVGERLQLWKQGDTILKRATTQWHNLLPGEWRELLSEVFEMIARTGPAIARELAAAQHLQVPLQPCLRDIWHDHVLFTGDAVTGLIDPSACRAENVAADLSRLLGSLVEDNVAAWDAALAIYRQFRPLSLAEESLIGVLDRSGIVLSALTWLKWLLVDERSFPDAAAVQTRIQTLHRRLVRLAQRM